MKLKFLIAVFVATCITHSDSNPNLQKGELIQAAITKLTQKKPAGAIYAFLEIGELALYQPVTLSLKEEKLFYESYHFRRLQLLNAVVNSEHQVNKNIVQKLFLLSSITKSIIQDLSANAHPADKASYTALEDKVIADEFRVQAWYTLDCVNQSAVRYSIVYYKHALQNFEVRREDQFITFVDTCLGYSMSLLEDRIINDHGAGPNPCIISSDCIEMMSSDTIVPPELNSLINFVETHCKKNKPDIFAKYPFVKPAQMWSYGRSKSDTDCLPILDVAHYG